jgi:hypothetical protein
MELNLFYAKRWDDVARNLKLIYLVKIFAKLVEFN